MQKLSGHGIPSSTYDWAGVVGGGGSGAVHDNDEDDNDASSCFSLPQNGQNPGGQGWNTRVNFFVRTFSFAESKHDFVPWFILV